MHNLVHLGVIDAFSNLGATVLQVALWTVIGCLFLAGAMKLIDLLTPGKLQDQVFKDENVAAAIVYGAAFVGIAIVIASAMH
jgi:uncharacterized membrane protein YjfL (UPF0719 family)